MLQHKTTRHLQSTTQPPLPPQTPTNPTSLGCRPGRPEPRHLALSNHAKPGCPTCARRRRSPGSKDPRRCPWEPVVAPVGTGVTAHRGAYGRRRAVAGRRARAARPWGVKLQGVGAGTRRPDQLVAVEDAFEATSACWDEHPAASSNGRKIPALALRDRDEGKLGLFCNGMVPGEDRTR